MQNRVNVTVVPCFIEEIHAKMVMFTVYGSALFKIYEPVINSVEYYHYEIMRISEKEYSERN